MEMIAADDGIMSLSRSFHAMELKSQSYHRSLSVEDISRSFRDDDYTTNRRVFLRSYPLQWEEEEEEIKEMEVPKAYLKNKFIAALHWSEGKILRLKKLRRRVSFRLIANHSMGIKSSNKLISL